MISVGNLFILNMQLLLLVERIAVFVFVKEKKNKKGIKKRNYRQGASRVIYQILARSTIGLALQTARVD